MIHFTDGETEAQGSQWLQPNHAAEESVNAKI